jgi:hypothetical protein
LLGFWFEWVESKHLNIERSNLLHYNFYKNLMWASIFSRKTHKAIGLTFSFEIFNDFCLLIFKFMVTSIYAYLLSITNFTC